IDTCVKLCEQNNLGGWRQHTYHQRQFKKQYCRVQRLKHSTSKDEKKRQQKQAQIQQAHRSYLELVESHLARAEQTCKQSPANCPITFLLLHELNDYLGHTLRQIERINRRVLRGERIPP
ncbi:MAG: ISNCY family transposase, partial [Candidatus Thiodiazotropha sp. (ex Lucinoma aequizonata)]|nr:ISNCY family transposase [Candidatus Thiodiazotropha sp. (ex Lucinoma aequizonata)]